MKQPLFVFVMACLSLQCTNSEHADLEEWQTRVSTLEAQIAKQNSEKSPDEITHSHPLLIKGDLGGCYFPQVLAGAAPFGYRGLLLDDPIARLNPGARERSCQLASIQIVKRTEAAASCIVDFDVVVNFYPAAEKIEPLRLEIRGASMDENGNVTIRFPLFPCQHGPGSVHEISIVEPGA